MSSPDVPGPPPQPQLGWLRRAVFRTVRALMPFVARLEGRAAHHEQRLEGIERGLGDLSREALPALLERLQRLGDESRAASEAAQSLAERVRADAERNAGSEARLAIQAASQARHGALLAELAARLEALEATAAEGARSAARTSALETRLDALASAQADARRAVEEGLARTEAATAERHREGEFPRQEAERLGRILAATARVRMAPPSPTLVSVVLATRDRAPLLAEALRSVRAQSHERWELVLVDDGSRDATSALLSDQQDPRVKVVRTSGVGAAAARNRGLAVAQGALVAYLDDDNLMDPDWLRAVAWAFDAYPAARVLYGAQVAEDERSRAGPLDRRFWVRFEAWDRARLERENFVDISAVAHRRLSEARFDESLTRLEDWDLLLRLTQEAPPLRLPVLAGVYRAEPIPRLSTREPIEPNRARILAKLAGPGSAGS